MTKKELKTYLAISVLSTSMAGIGLGWMLAGGQPPIGGGALVLVGALANFVNVAKLGPKFKDLANSLT